MTGVATKYVIRWRGSQVFNPSNLGLVIAFVVLGGDRIEPLDFWWGPFSVWMLLAYWLIGAGGVLVTERLGLLELAGAFWITFALCMAAPSASGHCITAPWSASAVCDERFWWVIVVATLDPGLIGPGSRSRQSSWSGRSMSSRSPSSWATPPC